VRLFADEIRQTGKLAFPILAGDPPFWASIQGLRDRKMILKCRQGLTVGAVIFCPACFEDLAVIPS
jgi:hypothetical protein